MAVLTPRWTPLTPKEPQLELWESLARFRVGSAGRRSGKTELAKRFLVVGNPDAGFLGALTYDLPFDDGFFIASAPTHDQAKQIFWHDLKSLVPKKFVTKISESDRSIKLYNQTEIRVIGMDKPERAEGRPIDGIIMDEYANMKKEAWTHHVRPGLSTLGREGWAWLIGVPEGRNHYWQTFKRAEGGEDPLWSAHTWPSRLVLSKEEVEAAQRELDPLTFEQEYEGGFVNFAGRAYYAFGDHNVHEGLRHFPHEELYFCFDFNVAPGVAVVCQDQYKSWYREDDLPDKVAERFTAVIGEVWVQQDSNTPRICKELKKLFPSKRHPGPVTCHGDATGGAKGTAQVRGSDWDIIEEDLEEEYEDQLDIAVGRSNPRERVRVNAMNSRCKTMDGTVRLLVDPRVAPKLIEDFEGVRTKDDGSGEIDKKKDPALTHMTDALGYFVAEEHPIGGAQVTTTQVP